MKTIFNFCASFCLLCVMTSCGGDDNDPGSVNCNNTFDYNVEIQDELASVNAAGLAFANDPSADNCQTLVAAWQVYLDALKPYESCADQAGQGQDFDDAILAAEASIVVLEMEC